MHIGFTSDAAHCRSLCCHTSTRQCCNICDSTSLSFLCSAHSQAPDDIAREVEVLTTTPTAFATKWPDMHNQSVLTTLEECIPAHHTVAKKMHGDACSAKSSLPPPPARNGVRRARLASAWQHKPQNSCKLIQIQADQAGLHCVTYKNLCPKPWPPWPYSATAAYRTSPRRSYRTCAASNGKAPSARSDPLS